MCIYICLEFRKVLYHHFLLENIGKGAELH